MSRLRAEKSAQATTLEMQRGGKINMADGMWVNADPTGKFKDAFQRGKRHAGKSLRKNGKVRHVCAENIDPERKGAHCKKCRGRIR